MTTSLAPLVETLTVGRLRVHTIQAGGQKLDGGAMFGVVPKPLWERRIVPDERNRIQLGMRCLAIEHESGVVLVDTGSGNKETEKFHDIYGIDNAGTNGRTLLEDGLAQIGVRPEDVAIVGMDNIEFGEYAGVPLSSVDYAVETVTRMAVERLMRLIAAGDLLPEPRITQIDPDLVIRESTRAPR